MDQFIKSFEKKVENTLKKYKLANKKEKIVVACSGGKDSTTVLYILHKLGYDVEALIIDLKIGDFSKKNLENIRKFCSEHKIKLNVVDIRNEFGHSMCYIRSAIQDKRKINNCAVCGAVKKWLLNRKARELKVAKIVTGHNLDDIAETILMNYLRGNPDLSLGLFPKGGIIRDKKFVQRIKPLYFCKNNDIMRYSKLMKFPVLYEPCPCSSEVYRKKIRNLLNDLELKHKHIKDNIVANFLKQVPRLKKPAKINLKYCRICNEPSRNDICQMCSLLKVMG